MLRLREQQAGFLGILALLASFAYMAQGGNWNQDAHYALVKSLAEGTPYIDKSIRPVGPQRPPRLNDRTLGPSSRATGSIGPAVARHGDIAYFRGHAYAAKAPGLAFVALPAYVLLKAIHVSTVESPDAIGALWFLGLFGVVLPSAILLLLVRQVADDVEPGYGIAAAVILGVCTLILPFSTLFFAHVLSTTLGFAAFTLLCRKPCAHNRLLVAGAGVCAGLAITTEYTLALVALVLAIYAFFQRRRLVDASTFIAGTMLGVLPLLLYQWWAFGSMFHLSYAGVAGNTGGVFGVGVPHWRVAGQLLFSRIGLVRLSPVLVLGVVGAVFLYRQQKRREGLVVLGLICAFIVFNSAYATPFGGLSPGPRFLIPILPFVVFPLAVVLRRLPLTTLSLAAPSAVLMLVVTATNPLIAGDGNWFSRLFSGKVTHTIVNHLLYPYSGWLPIIPFFLSGLLALALATRAMPPIRTSRADAITAGGAFTSWLALAISGSSLSSGALLLLLAVVLTTVMMTLSLKALAQSDPLLPLNRHDHERSETAAVSGD